MNYKKQSGMGAIIGKWKKQIRQGRDVSKLKE